MFDMRYHIASLVSVFLALTVGLLLGSLIVDKGMLASQQEKLLQSIKADVDQINERNVALQSDLEKLESFQDQVFPVTVKDRLRGQAVVVAVFTNEQDELLSEIKNAIDLAGGETYPLRIDSKKLDFSSKRLVNKLGSKFDLGDSKGGAFERRFWTRFAGELSGQEPPDLTNELISSELISLDTTSIPAENLVIVAAAKKMAGNRDSFLLSELAKEGSVRMIGVEEVDTKPSRIRAYKLRNISTIDNVDEVSGKISLVYLLAEDDITAHYGVKSTAERLLP